MKDNILRMHLRKNEYWLDQQPKPEKIWNEDDHKMLEMLSVVTINEDAHGQNG